MWKIKLVVVYNPGISFYTSDWRGTMAEIPHLKQSSTLNEQSFPVKGQNYFCTANETTELSLLKSLKITA